VQGSCYRQAATAVGQPVCCGALSLPQRIHADVPIMADAMQSDPPRRPQQSLLCTQLLPPALCLTQDRLASMCHVVDVLSCCSLIARRSAGSSTFCWKELVIDKLLHCQEKAEYDAAAILHTVNSLSVAGVVKTQLHCGAVLLCDSPA
jgi:hypothetical protein